MKYTLLQQSKVGEDSRTQAEGLLTRYPVIETASLDYRSHNCVALAARFEIDGRLLDVYVTHLIAARVEDAARQYQVGQLREWIRTRDDADFAVVCGDFNASPDQPSIRLMSGAFRRLKPNRPPSRRCRNPVAAPLIRSGSGLIAASTTSGLPNRLKSRLRVFALIGPRRTIPLSGLRITWESGRIWSWFDGRSTQTILHRANLTL